MAEEFDREFDKEFEQIRKNWVDKLSEHLGTYGKNPKSVVDALRDEAFEEFFKSHSGFEAAEEQEAFKKGYDNYMDRFRKGIRRDSRLDEIYKSVERTMASVGIDAKDEETEKSMASKELEEFFKREGITDPKDQEPWKKDFETYKARRAERKAKAEEAARNAKIEQLHMDIGDKIAKGMKPDDANKEAFEEFFKREKITDPKEQEAWMKDFETYFDRKAEREADDKEELKGKLRDRQIAGIWKDFGLKVAAGMDPKKAKPEALEDFFKREGITDPKEKEAWKKDFETYFDRKAEKEKAAADAHKKSGRKILGNGVVSKWLSRNKDKLIGGAALGIGVVAATNAAVGGFGLMAPIVIAGVSSTVFPPFIALGAGLVACNYLKNVYAKRKAEKEAAKGKDETKRGPMPAPRGKDGGR